MSELSTRIEGLDEAQRRLSKQERDRRIKDGMTKAVLELEREAKRNAPVRTGRLRSSITHRVEDGGWTGIVGTDVRYARIVEEGAGPHVILPKSGRALHWDDVTVQQVEHPGSRGQHFMARTLQEKRDKVMQIIRRAVEG
jgi:HK97 gp10 family phage protein